MSGGWFGPDNSHADDRFGAAREAAADLLTRGWSEIFPPPEVAELGERALAAARQVFALPAGRKRSLADPSGGGHVGWRAASRNERPDEVWQLEADDRCFWPGELGAEREDLELLRVGCAGITSSILGTLAPEVGLCSDEARQSVSAADSVVRLLHYVPREQGHGFAPHTDLGLATFFTGETVTGLELENTSGEWVPTSSGWALAAGEMLAVRTAGRVRPGRHRVRSCPVERWAVAVFVHPSPDYELGRDAEGRSFTAREFFGHKMSAYTGGTTPGTDGSS